MCTWSLFEAVIQNWQEENSHVSSVASRLFSAVIFFWEEKKKKKNVNVYVE